jgi:hypothetical protein
LIVHSGFIQFDIDFKENSHITNYSDLKSEICKIVNVAYCGLSVSGTGLWGLIPILYPDRHRQHFDFIYNAFKKLGITIDKKPGNVASLRGYSYDINGYFNRNAVKLNEYNQTRQNRNNLRFYSHNDNSIQSDVEALINELRKTGVDITNTYDNWVSIGFALATEFGERGRQYFHVISRNNACYDRNENNYQYDKCLNAGSTPNPITVKTFFAKCKDAGIVLPKEVKKTGS